VSPGRVLRYAFQLAYSRALWSLIAFALLLCVSQLAQAQTVCYRFTDPGIGLDVEGTPTQACAATAAAFGATFPDRAPATVSSCTYDTSLTVGLTISNPTEAGQWIVTGVSACSGEPPGSEPEPGTSVPLSWANTAHLLQALLIAACLFIFVNGINAGNRL
jgi:hypothetical protein